MVSYLNLTDMDFYIARDEDGALYLYFAKPIRFDDYFDVVCTHEPVYLDNTTFPDVTWENSPKKLVLEDKTKLRLPVGGSDFDIDATNKRLEFIEKRLVELNASIEKIMDIVSIGNRLS